MTNESAQWLQDPTAARWLRWTAGLYFVAWLVHTGDHLRRGSSSVTVEVLVIGYTAAVFQVAAVALVFGRHRLSPLIAAMVGIPDGLGIAAVHLLPKWSVFSDAFPGAHGTGVTGFSWVAAVLEIIGALSFGAAGLYALRRVRSAPTGATSLAGVPSSMLS